MFRFSRSSNKIFSKIISYNYKKSPNLCLCSQVKPEKVIHLPASLPQQNDSTHSFHIVTPLLKSTTMTKELSSFSSFQRNVYLKLDSVQPSGSFKIRGIGWTMQEAVRNGAHQFVGSSGGNAGMAMAFAAGKLGKKLALFVPKDTPGFMEQKLVDEGAEVFLVGDNWDEANDAALAKVAKDCSDYTFMVHPHNQPSTWEGNSSLVDELVWQLKELGEEVPSCIVATVGGGGLAMGLLKGMERHEWKEVVLLALETKGAASLLQSVEQGKLVTLETVNTRAISLAMKSVVEELFVLAMEQPNRLKCAAVSDKEALEACLRFADDERILVEPACGAALAGVYSGMVGEVGGKGPVVVIVCGGNMVNLHTLEEWKEELDW